MKKRMLWLIALMLMLSGCSGLDMSAIGGPGAYALPDWIPIAVVAIIISFLIISLVYMAGEIFQNPELLAWAKNEFFQTAAVALMLGMLFFFLSFLDKILIPAILENTVVSYAPGPYSASGDIPTTIPVEISMFDVAQGYLFAIAGYFVAEFTALIYLDMVIGLFQNATIRWAPMGIGFIISPGAFFTPFFHFVNYGLNFLGIAMWAVQLQLAILQFSKQTMFKLFLPLGIVFRSFPFTRGVGGVLIATAIAFYVVYPLTFFINMSVAENHYSTVDHNALVTNFNAWVFGLSQGVGSGGPLDLFGTIWYFFILVISVGISRYALPFELFAYLIGGNNITGIMQEMFYGILVFTTILPIINVFITLTFARELANFFGTDVNLTSISRIL